MIEPWESRDSPMRGTTLGVDSAAIHCLLPLTTPNSRDMPTLFKYNQHSIKGDYMISPVKSYKPNKQYPVTMYLSSQEIYSTH